MMNLLRLLGILGCLLTATRVLAADDGLSADQRKMRNLNAIQVIYRHGVPNTDKQGHRLYKYEAGKSFFPIGMWGAPLPGDVYGSHYDWDTLKKAGFNTVWPWNTPVKPAIEAAKKAGLQLILMTERTEAELKEMKDNPWILGNVWADEPIGALGSRDMDKYFADYLKYRGLAQQFAPGLNVFTNGAPWITAPATSWWIKWNTTGDVSCHDNYPVKFSDTITRSVGSDPNGIPQSVSLAVGSNSERKPVWLIVGAFDQPGAHQAFPFRFPSAMQLRAEVYSGIIHGATGIHYFIEDSYVSRDGGVIGMSPDPKVYRTPFPIVPGGPKRPTPATPMQLAQSRALWEATAAINSELKQLTPIILAATVGQKVDYKVDITGRSITESPIRCLLKPDPDGGYVLLSVNLDDAVLETTYTFPRDISQVEGMFENQPPQVFKKPQKSFAIHYEPYEVHVLRIKQ
jgi:hypothetical protein